MKEIRIFLILICVGAFIVTGCEKKNTNEVDSRDSSTSSTIITSSQETTTITTTTTTTTSKKITTKKTTTSKRIPKSTTTATKKVEQNLIDGKPECDKNNAEFVTYVENYKNSYASKNAEFAKKEAYTMFFYTKKESDDYASYASRLGYAYEGSSIPYENSTCKGKLYTKVLVIRAYNGKTFNPEVYIPATPKDKLISAENYLSKQGLI